MHPEIIRQALKKNKVKSENYKGLEYLRFTDDFQDIHRGTAIFKSTVIWGYPHIGRIFHLSTGIREQFSQPFYVEEKVDGYNTRIFLLEDQILALSRGGYICPFTTERVLEFINPKFFEDNPDLILCAEVAGPENPYVEEHPPYIKEDIKIFVFDIMKKNSREFLPYSEKERLIEKYGLPSVERFGLFTPEDVEEIKKLLKRLNDEGKEGVVFKEDSERNKRVKYVTLYSSLRDIEITSINLLGLPSDYFTNRLLRLALFMEEEGIGANQELFLSVGKAFLEGLLKAIDLSKRERKVYRTFRCRFKTKENALLFLENIKHASSQIQVIERSLKKEGDFWILEFDRVYLNMTGLLGHLLAGGSIFD
ncbi:RNA ligase [Thermocrinis sp.]